MINKMNHYDEITFKKTAIRSHILMKALADRFPFQINVLCYVQFLKNKICSNRTKSLLIAD